MLITRPNHDIATNYLYYWCVILINLAKKRKISVSDLAKDRANALEFTSVVTKTKPKLIVLNGHGDESVVTGHNNEILIQADKNHNLLRGSVVYSRSCKSARKLGPQAVMAGCKAYIGYNEDFVFVTEDTKISRPLDDKTAQLFLEPSNQVVISLLKGHTPIESNKRSKEAYKRNIQKLMSSSSTKENVELIPNLVWDYMHQVCLEPIIARTNL